MDLKHRLNTVDDYNKMIGIKTRHPLISIIDYAKTESIIKPDKSVNYDFAELEFNIFGIYFKSAMHGDIYYGQNKYDYKEGTLVFIAPGQSLKFKKLETELRRTGWALVFHPDLISGTILSRNMASYSFFSYESNEALHLSDEEKEIVFDIFAHISHEINARLDAHTNKLLLNHLKMLLDYSVRFYDRQFLSRENLNKGVLEQFNNYLNAYFESTMPQFTGLPSVSTVAKELNLSPNYFGDLVKRESGKTALEFIHLKVISLAKARMQQSNKSVSEIAYDLGFSYPQHFTRLFKKQVGLSPREYRQMH